MKRRVWCALVLALVTTGGMFAMTACGGGVDSGGVMRIALPSDPAFIDPVNIQEQLGVQVGDCLFDSLTAFDHKTGELVAGVAESWETNEDASVWTFNLRPDTKFHDGTTVIAADFKYSWERICNPDNLSEISYHLGDIQGYGAMQDGSATELEGVKVIDDYTLEVTLSNGAGDFEYVVGHTALAPVPKAAVEGDPEFSERPVGNGPFMIAPDTKWEHDEMIGLVRFDDYYGDKALLDGVDFLIYQDEETAYIDFEAGNLDWANVPPAQIAAAQDKYGMSDDGLEGAPGKQFLWGPEVGVSFLCIKSTDDVLSNEALRQALSLAVNRDAIATVVFEGTRSPANGIVPPGIAGYEADSWEYCKYDVQAAKDKLAEAGYPDGEGLPELSLRFVSGSGSEDAIQLIQSDWEAVGVSTKLDSEEWGQYLPRLFAGGYQVADLAWGADYPIMAVFLFPLFGSESDSNLCLWSNAEVDFRLDAATSIADSQERIAEYQAINMIIGESVPVIPVVFDGHRQVQSERVNGLIYSPLTMWNLNEAWLSE